MEFDKYINRYFNEKYYTEIKKNILFQEYFNLLCKWKKKVNITGFNDEEIFFRAILEPLLILKREIILDETLIDIGTGAGIPSISYAIFFKKLKVFGVEINKKKLAFLEYVKQELNLENFFPTKKCPKITKWITARAFMNIDDFIKYLIKNNIKYEYLIFFFKDKSKKNIINELVIKENISYYFNKNKYEITIFKKKEK